MDENHLIGLDAAEQFASQSLEENFHMDCSANGLAKKRSRKRSCKAKLRFMGRLGSPDKQSATCRATPAERFDAPTACVWPVGGQADSMTYVNGGYFWILP